MKRFKIATCLAFAVGAALTLTGCSGQAAPAPSSSAAPSDPISQMEIAFEGAPRKSEISAALDRAFDAVGQVASDSDYSRAGSVLVSFREKYGISEMKILECIPYRANDPRAPEKTFPNVAAVCLTDLASGVKIP